jgi:transglutaminase-like putative cysteine protease
MPPRHEFKLVDITAREREPRHATLSGYCVGEFPYKAGEPYPDMPGWVITNYMLKPAGARPPEAHVWTVVIDLEECPSRAHE